MDIRTGILAHRGASHEAPENTMEAFVRAHEIGADGIELDVSFSRDGHIIVLHDDSIDRTSNGSGVAANMDYRDLNQYDYNFGMPGFKDVHLPTLEEVLRWAGPLGMIVNIEIKPRVPLGAGIERQIDTLAKKFDMLDRIIVSSFNHYLLSEVKRVNPAIRVGALYSHALVNPWIYASENGFEAIHPHYETLNMPGVIAGCAAAQIAIHPWTVNSEAVLTRHMEAGLANVITDRPDIALQVRSRVQG